VLDSDKDDLKIQVAQWVYKKLILLFG